MKMASIFALFQKKTYSTYVTKSSFIKTCAKFSSMVRIYYNLPYSWISGIWDLLQVKKKSSVSVNIEVEKLELYV
jgi:hypothetical protein